jgi:hypothetical protein
MANLSLENKGQKRLLGRHARRPPLSPDEFSTDLLYPAARSGIIDANTGGSARIPP